MDEGLDEYEDNLGDDAIEYTVIDDWPSLNAMPRLAIVSLTF